MRKGLKKMLFEVMPTSDARLKKTLMKRVPIARSNFQGMSTDHDSPSIYDSAPVWGVDDDGEEEDALLDVSKNYDFDIVCCEEFKNDDVAREATTDKESTN